jgi:hypothetical protein
MNFIVNDFLNTISINDTNSIYINILNKVTLTSYETTFIKKDIPNLMDIPSFYNLMIKCFEDNSLQNNYSVKYEVSDGKIAITFNAKVDNIFNIAHTLYIKESIINSDKLVTTKINSIKEQYETEINELKEQYKTEINKLKETCKNEINESIMNYHKLVITELNSMKEIYLTEIIELRKSLNDKINNEPILIISSPTYIYLNKSINKLDLSSYNNNDIKWLNFNRFTNIYELKINTSYIQKEKGYYTGTIWPFPYNNYIFNSDKGVGNQYFDIFNFPTIRHLIITNKTDTPPYPELGELQNIPNIEKLTLENFSHKINIVEHIKCLTKLKEIVFINTPHINQITELRQYCITNKIKLLHNNLLDL